MRNYRSNSWSRRLNLYLRNLGMSFEQMVGMKKGQLIRNILRFGSMRWYNDMIRKTSLGIYRRKKKGIKDEKINSNNRASELLFRARSNTIDLNAD